jgi:enterochelin esterase-like enzyme
LDKVVAVGSSREWNACPARLAQAKGQSVNCPEFCGGHDYVSWRGSFADGLTSLAGVSGKE